MEAEKGNFARFRNLRDASLCNLWARNLQIYNWQFATLNLAHQFPNVQYNDDIIASSGCNIYFAHMYIFIMDTIIGTNTPLPTNTQPRLTTLPSDVESF